VGEDGPTHQPVEHLAALRCIPNVRVLRPADAEEAVVAWKMALERTDGPTVLALSRQSLPVLPKADPDWENTMRLGAYIVKNTAREPDLVVLASGSEVSLALAASEGIPGKDIRVLSVPSLELFRGLDDSVRSVLAPPEVRTVTVEAGSAYGWDAFATSRGDVLSVDRFGASGPGDKVAAEVGMTLDRLSEILAR